MKKILFYSVILAAGLFTSCAEDYTDWADPQGYDQDAIEADMGFTAASVSTIVMTDVTSETIATFTSSITLPEGGEITGYTITLDDTETLEADADGLVATDDLATAVENLYGKRPEPRTMTQDISVYVAVDETVLTQSATTSLTVTLQAPEIADAYYLIGNLGWTEDDMEVFSHSDSDVYDDPEFSLVFTVTEAIWWKIVPQTSVDAGDIWTGILGPTTDGDDSFTGTLTSDNPGAGYISEAGMYKMVINMMDYSYEITQLDFPSHIYIAGDMNSWTFLERLYCNYDGNYTGFAEVGGTWGFKLYPEADNWDNCYTDTDFATVVSPMTTYSGNLYVEETGFYYINADCANSVLSGALIETVSLIGGAVEGDTSWSTDAYMTLSDDYQTWTYSGPLTAGEFKFRMNDAWDINLGGSLTDLTQDGANLSIDADGDYTVVLYLTRSTYDNLVCTITAN